MRPVVTLTTDFGLDDSYVGVMKGVMLSICADLYFVDITHKIGPQDVPAAALLLPTYAPYFPPDTVHLVVVDPGVGSARRPVALSTPHGRYVGPDNGVFSLIWQQARAHSSAAEVRAVVTDEPRFWRPQISATFHGRDIFAPIAAHLAAGVALEKLGSPLDAPVMLALPEPAWNNPAHLVGEIVLLDHFGNCISNITTDHLQQIGPLNDLCVSVVGQSLRIAHTYADVSPGAALALIGSDGYLEVAVRDGSAAHSLGLTRGAALAVTRE